MPTPRALRPDHDPSLQATASWSLGPSASIRGFYDAVQRIANATSPVLIVGEPGAGKESVARTLHHLGGRRHGPFTVITCAALVGGLANDFPSGGTLYLDGVGNLNPRAQDDLMRVIEQRPLSEAGRDTTAPPDVRVVAATPVNLEPAVRAGRFREDLYRRLAAESLTVPALRERRDDIPSLVAHGLNRINHSHPSATTIAPETMARLVGYAWPGNFRELNTLIEHLAARPTGSVIREADLPADILAGESPRALGEGVRHGAVSLTQAVDAFERELIVEALERTSHVQVRAAKQLGITRRILKYKMDLLGIPVKRPRTRARREAA